MKLGENKTFIYIPFLGMVEAADTIEETMIRIERARVDQEIENKKTLRRLKKKFPNYDIIPDGQVFKMIPRDKL